MSVEMWSRKMNFTKISVLAALLINSSFVMAFGQDVCSNGKEIIGCLLVSKSCHTDKIKGEKVADCKQESTRASLKTGVVARAGRSLVHEDGMYLIAQLFGFTPWQAYVILQYGAIADMIYYDPFDQAGRFLLTQNQTTSCQNYWANPIKNRGTLPEVCLVTSPVLNGFSRFFSKSGGMWIHSQIQYQADASQFFTYNYPTDSYTSGPAAPFNPTVTNLRNWAFGKRTDACVLGITRNMQLPDSETSPCVSNNNVFVTTRAVTGYSETENKVKYVTPLGVYVLNRPTSRTRAGRVMATDNSLQDYIDPQGLAFAKLGIYLHALGDRYSHHDCTDTSYFTEHQDGNYVGVFNQKTCAQGDHFWNHVLEQGTKQKPLEDQHQTMRPGLEAMYDEMQAFAEKKGTKYKAVEKQNVINDIMAVLQIANTKKRLDAMVKLSEKYDVLPLPKHGSYQDKSIHEWLVAAKAPLNQTSDVSEAIIDEKSQTLPKPVGPELGTR